MSHASWISIKITSPSLLHVEIWVYTQLALLCSVNIYFLLSHLWDYPQGHPLAGISFSLFSRENPQLGCHRRGGFLLESSFSFSVLPPLLQAPQLKPFPPAVSRELLGAWRGPVNSSVLDIPGLAPVEVL